MFGGAIVLTASALLLHLWAENPAALSWIVAALALYLVALVITGLVNVPLNNGLLADERPERGDSATARRGFERRWVRWNVVRAVAATAAFGCLCAALVRAGAA